MFQGIACFFLLAAMFWCGFICGWNLHVKITDDVKKDLENLKKKFKELEISR